MMKMKCIKCSKRAVFHYKANGKSLAGSVCALHNKRYLFENSKEGRLEKRTIDIIKKHGKIVLKNIKSDWYLNCWTNLAAGFDKASWGLKRSAQEFYSLELAFAIAPLYKSKVFVIYPKRS